jgi:hypothetical protein
MTSSELAGTLVVIPEGAGPVNWRFLQLIFSLVVLRVVFSAPR